mgnify:CR=1 FL=1
MIEVPGYTIVRKIGEGGMATVYLAVQQSLGRRVALKVIKSTQINDSNFNDRFLKEGRIIAQFQHPQIITIYDFGSNGPHSYFSMEFLPEGTLAQHIERGLSPERALEIIKSVSGALAYAHRRGVIHRDIKPQNILFRQDGTPVLSDFGIAKIVDADDTQLTAPGLAIGSPVYMSPEQITGKPLDSRSDLYSLGIVFYEMLVREPPYRADDVISIAMMHCTQPLPRLPDGLGRFQPVLQKLLAKTPAERFETAEQLIDALDHPESSASLRNLIDTARMDQTLGGALFSKKSGLIGGLSLLAMLVGGGVYLALNRQPVDSYEQLALKHFQNGEFTQSLELVKLGLAASPEDGRLLALRERAERYRSAADLLEQARQNRRDGSFEQGLRRVEDGLRQVPDHGELLALRQALQTQLRERQGEADRLLAQAHARWQAGDLEGGLQAAEQGLQRAPDHPELSTLRTVLQNRLKERQLVPQLVDTVRELLRQGRLEDSLKRIEDGLLMVPEQPDLLELRRQASAAIAANQRIDELLRDCANRFPLERLTGQQGGEIAACYRQIAALAPDPDRVRAALQQVGDRYAELADAAIRKADLQLAGDYLAQLALIQSGHPRLATLNHLLQTKRKQAESEARRAVEEEAKRQAVEDAKRRGAEDAKRRAIEKALSEPAPANIQARPKAPATTVLKSELNPSPKPAKPRPELAGPSRQKGPKTHCREALLKAQLGEPLSATEQEECQP